jgi:hypothetical protein
MLGAGMDDMLGMTNEGATDGDGIEGMLGLTNVEGAIDGDGMDDMVGITTADCVGAVMDGDG